MSLISAPRALRFIDVIALAIVAIACGATTPTASPAVSRPPTQAATLAPSVPPISPPATPAVLPSLPPPPPTETPGGAPTILLEVTSEGGFIAPSAHLGELPTVVVATAGDIYTPTPVVACPSPGCDTLIPPVVVRDVGASGAAKILAAMRAAGLDREGSSGVPGDAGVTVFTAEIDGQEIVNRLAASGPGPGHPGASPQAALELLNRLLDPTETWGATDVKPTTFDATAYKLYVAPATESGSTTAAWPLASLADFGSPATPDFGVTGLRTGVVFGDDAGKLADALGDQPSGTQVTSDGQSYQVWIRPLLPPEITQ